MKRVFALFLSIVLLVSAVPYQTVFGLTDMPDTTDTECSEDHNIDDDCCSDDHEHCECCYEDECSEEHNCENDQCECHPDEYDNHIIDLVAESDIGIVNPNAASDQCKCSTCGGTRYVQVKCSNCSGTGRVSGNVYCSRCDGTGKVSQLQVCSTCKGFGGRVLCECTCGNVWWADQTGSRKCSKCGRTVTGTQYTTCSDCGGSGSRYVSVNCSLCNGSGWVYSSNVPCSICEGSGTKSVLCTTCDGTGYIHTPGSAVQENVVQPTCTSSGSYNLVVDCNVCGAKLSSDKKTLAALGHDWGDWFVTVPATCEGTGTKCSICKRDSSHTKTSEIAPLGHSWGDWTVTTAPTCTKEGVMTRICANDSQHMETESLAALGHDWEPPQYQWSDDNTLTAFRRCARDSSHIESEQAYISIDNYATCEGYGEVVYTATFFNANYGTNFTNSYRLNYRDHTVNVRAAFELKLANVPSANAFQDIIRGFPKSRYDVTVPINYMRSANSGGVAILYANGTLAINRSAITAVNDYVFIDWIYLGDESLFV